MGASQNGVRLTCMAYGSEPGPVRFQQTAASWRTRGGPSQSSVQPTGRWLLVENPSIVPLHRHETEALTVLCNVTDGWERDVRCGQQRAGFSGFVEQRDARGRRHFRLVLEAVLPCGMIEAHFENHVADERQFFAL